jgi:hypothetical protein
MIPPGGVSSSAAAASGRSASSDGAHPVTVFLMQECAANPHGPVATALNRDMAHRIAQGGNPFAAAPVPANAWPLPATAQALGLPAFPSQAAASFTASPVSQTTNSSIPASESGLLCPPSVADADTIDRSLSDVPARGGAGGAEARDGGSRRPLDLLSGDGGLSQLQAFAHRAAEWYRMRGGGDRVLAFVGHFVPFLSRLIRYAGVASFFAAAARSVSTGRAPSAGVLS